MRREVKEMKRRRAKESADGLALMTSLVTSSQSEDGLSPAVARYQQRATVQPVEETQVSDSKTMRLHKLIRQRFAFAIKIQQMLFPLITSSRKISAGRICLIPAGQPDASNSTSSRESQRTSCVLHPVARFIQSTRYDGSSRELQYYASSRKDPDARKVDVAKHCNQAQSIQSTKISAEDEFSRSDKSAAKQLMIYESWMSTAELNSNGENDKKPAK
ncbi:hypothetical protein F511_44815 [Dorcoceras hygrometricum]|uniref:Uncharacterized protein n=1 Tax=Dorcoceras hygrometricum TaxID=472368 RepID=A0A2Z6ZXF2_9LAMI|nr:hypothetical protein F511_44815 [Dorcoceras hygrometricum]